MRTVVERARELVAPSAESRAKRWRLAGMILERVKERCSGIPEIREVVLGGSLPKDTWLPDMADIDILVKFERETTRERFVELARSVGFGALEDWGPYVRYSEHPFVEATVDGTRINVVPCFMVEAGRWQSSADRTPHHTEFMMKSLSAAMREDVRLLKRFLKSNALYGAEIAKQGFSGYVTEVLVWNLKSFEGVVRWFAGVGRGQTIGKVGRDFDTPVIIADPVDPLRNLAAAISEENIGRFVLLCRAFLERPEISFFGDGRPGRNTGFPDDCITVRFRYGDRSPDMIWGQLKSAASAAAQQLEQGGFRVVRSGALTDENGLGVLFFLLESDLIPEFRVRDGPDFFSGEDARMFISRNRNRSRMLWVSGGRIRSLERRPERDAGRFLRRLLTERLEISGVPDGIKPDIRGGFRVSRGGTGLPSAIRERLGESLSTDGAILYSD